MGATEKLRNSSVGRMAVGFLKKIWLQYKPGAIEPPER